MTRPPHAATPRSPVSDNKAARLLVQAGGISGLIYSSMPVLTFVIVSSIAGLLPAICAALGAAVLILGWRLLRRDSVQPALSGFFGVAICALIAYLVGQSKGYFLLGIWMSLAWAVVFAVSILIRRPVVGYLWSWASGRDNSWRAVPRAVHAFDLATLCWTVVFVARFGVQGHLYELGKTGWLGATRIAMGWPLTGLAALVTYVAIKAVLRATGQGGSTQDDVDAAAIDKAVLD